MSRSIQSVAVVTALAVAAVSLVCIAACFSLAPAMPCCPHHAQQHAKSCAPLFLSHPAAVLPAATPAPEAVRASLPAPQPARLLAVFLPPSLTLRI